MRVDPNNMFLASARVRRFRNLEDVTVSFGPGLNVIVGENNVGKTNLLDAIRSALGSAAQEPLRLGPDDRFDGGGASGKGPIQVDLTFEGLTEDDRGEFVELLNFDASNPDASTVSIHFEWSFDDAAARWTSRRWGGARAAADAGVPDDVLQALPLTRLDALRDAVGALAPGRANRLARALAALSRPEDEQAIVAALDAANSSIQAHDLIQRFEDRVASVLKDASLLGQTAVVRAAEPEFEKILNGLRLLVGDRTGTTRFELRRNGLGYNNLVYIATVLTELEARRDRALPLLLVEEPEAHLHPQLQTLLVDFLNDGATKPDPMRRPVQTIVTTHSPTIAAHVPPGTIRVLFANDAGTTKSCALGSLGLDAAQERKLRRMLDVTRATMLFARGVLLVEGISEALLVPVLARRLGKDLARAGVSVVPIAGVDFATLTKLYGPDRLMTKIAIVTDGDPEVHVNGGKRTPKTDPKTGAIMKSARLLKLEQEQVPHVGLFSSAVTFEYDLAKAAADNALVMHDAWSSLYDRGPALKRKTLEDEADTQERARLLWEAVCLGTPAHGKADLAQALADLLLEKNQANDGYMHAFTVPEYLRGAIEHVLPTTTPAGA